MASWTIMNAACLVPVDGQPQPDPHTPPPQIDPDQLQPLSPRVCGPFNAGGTEPSSCTFSISPGQIFAQHASVLLLRTVADNQSSFVKHIDDRSVPVIAGIASGIDIPVTASTSFFTFTPDEFLGPRSRPHVVSLFITDAAEWAIPQSKLDTTDQKDLGRIVTQRDDAGFPETSVIEIRWTFQFSNTPGPCQLVAGSCP
jgi:hypothetical protein